MDNNELAWAAFRTALISPLLTGEIPSGQLAITKLHRPPREQPHVKPAEKLDESTYIKTLLQISEHASRDALWNDTRMEEGLSRLNYLLGNGLVGLVTGASGLGKSALVRRFIQDCSPQVCNPQYCHLAQLPGSSLLKLIVTLLGEVPKFWKRCYHEHQIQTIGHFEQV